MRDDGFMMIDAMLSMLIFSVITAVLIPGIMMIKSLSQESETSLNFHRSLYIELLIYEDFNNFKNNTKKFNVSGDAICDEENFELCFEIE